MNPIIYPSIESWEKLYCRPATERTDLDKTVRRILDNVRKSGDKALIEYSLKYDNFKSHEFKVTRREITESGNQIADELKDAINIAAGNIEKFHRAQIYKEKVIETVPGIKCWRKNVAIEKAGLYIPGGSAPLFSSVLMLGIPAKIAGCRQVLLCTPPDSNGTINPVILFAAFITGISDIFRIGGAQAIAAMAYGTETIPKADKIFGPGNQYVTRAKELVQSDGIAIDMPAGPSEVLVIADESADPGFIAADLLSQAEHGKDSQVLLITNSKKIMEKVISEIEKQLEVLHRKDIAEEALENSIFILLSDLDKCMEFSNLYSPEHLIINTSDASSLAEKVVNAGSVFIGKYSCESAGDYASGTNHTLPTNGFARSFSGVSVDSFIKKITFQELSRKGLERIGPAIKIMADAESLKGHSNAVTIRLKKKGND
jgi:histidinol dehydrogenase